MKGKEAGFGLPAPLIPHSPAPEVLSALAAPEQQEEMPQEQLQHPGCSGWS